MFGVLIRRQGIWIETHGGRGGGMPCDDRGRDRSDAASRGGPKINGNHQKLGRSKKGF